MASHSPLWLARSSSAPTRCQGSKERTVEQTRVIFSQHNGYSIKCTYSLSVNKKGSKGGSL